MGKCITPRMSQGRKQKGGRELRKKGGREKQVWASGKNRPANNRPLRATKSVKRSEPNTSPGSLSLSNLMGFESGEIMPGVFVASRDLREERKQCVRFTCRRKRKKNARGGGGVGGGGWGGGMKKDRDHRSVNERDMKKKREHPRASRRITCSIMFERNEEGCPYP